MLDEFSRECLVIRVKRKPNLTDLIDALCSRRGRPRMVLSDNCKEFTSNATLKWQQEGPVWWHYSASGTSMQIGFVESFIGLLWDECLNEHLFNNYPDARKIINAWRIDCSHTRPHSSLNGVTPKSWQPGPKWTRPCAEPTCNCRQSGEQVTASV